MELYKTYGVNIQSELPLPELPSGETDIDVTVHFGKINLTSALIAGKERYLCKTTDGVILYWQNVGAFHVCSDHIMIDPLPATEERVLRAFLLGSCFGVLLHLRNSMVFHGSVAGFSGGAAAFLGRKGYGKSTMVAALQTHGYKLVSDDILALDVEKEQLKVRPGFPMVKLWPDAIEAIGENPDAHPLLFTDCEKRIRKIPESLVADSPVLKHIFILGGGDKLQIIPLPPKEALLLVLSHWYGAMFDGELLETFGLDKHLRECAYVAERIPVYLLKRPRDLKALPMIVHSIEKICL